MCAWVCSRGQTDWDNIQNTANAEDEESEAGFRLQAASATPHSDELYPSVQVVRSFPKMRAFSNEVMGQPTEGRSSRPQSLETCPFRMLSFARFPCPSEPDLAAPGRLDGRALGSFLRALGGKRGCANERVEFGTWASEYVGEGKL